MTPASVGMPSILGMAEHAGWAHIVCVSARGRRPFVLTRRRVTLIDRGLPTQPYHHETLSMPRDAAEQLVARVRGSIEATTNRALQGLVDELARDHPVRAVAIREPPFPALPSTVAAVHASYPLQCSADGMLYQLAICRAARRLGLDVQQYRRGGEAELAAAALGVAREDVEAFVVGAGRPQGPPWTAEHRRAYAAGIAALAAYVEGLGVG
jgi:hypothetical protein